MSHPCDILYLTQSSQPAFTNPDSSRARREGVFELWSPRVISIKDLAQRARRFLRTCLLCHHVKGGRVVPRPWGELYRSDVRNGALHWDFHYLGEGFGSSKYLLVLKDNCTHFTELVPCDSATSTVAAEAILAWHSRYGVPPVWVSDNGSHFMNQVVQELAKQLKSKQEFVLAYSPWVNGSVERANRDVLQVLRAMILEYRVIHKDWVYLIPIVQASLNHSSVTTSANKAPVELFTGLPCPSPANVLFLPDKPSVTVSVLGQPIAPSLGKLRTSIRDMHRAVLDQRKKRTLLNQRQSKGAGEVNFSVRDYVLRSRVDERRQNKLLVTWVGPYVVTRADSHSFSVKHLVTGVESGVHASCLKFYADNDLDVNDELLEHISAQGIMLKVDKLASHRWNDDIKDYELLVCWCGLERIEDSWELFRSLINDVPALVGAYVAQSRDAQLAAYSSSETTA